MLSPDTPSEPRGPLPLAVTAAPPPAPPTCALSVLPPAVVVVGGSPVVEGPRPPLPLPPVVDVVPLLAELGVPLVVAVLDVDVVPVFVFVLCALEVVPSLQLASDRTQPVVHPHRFRVRRLAGRCRQTMTLDLSRQAP